MGKREAHITSISFIMQKDYCCNGLVLSWKQVSWNRWETFEQYRDRSSGINRAVQQWGALLVTWFLIRPWKVVRLEQIRYDKLDLTEKRGEGAPSKKHSVHLTACLTVLGPMCHLLFSDAGEAQRLCWLLCSLPHSSSPYSFIFFSIHLKIWLFLSLWTAETTMLSWGENLYFSGNKPLAPELLAPAFCLSRQERIDI